MGVPLLCQQWFSPPVARSLLREQWHTVRPKAHSSIQVRRSTRLQAVLAVEVAIQETRPPDDRCRYSRIDSPNVSGESNVGHAENPLGTATPWLRCVEGNCGQVQNPPPQATISNVENLPGQSSDRHRRHRFLHRADCDISHPFLFRCVLPSPPHGHPLKRY